MVSCICPSTSLRQSLTFARRNLRSCCFHACSNSSALLMLSAERASAASSATHTCRVPVMSFKDVANQIRASSLVLTVSPDGRSNVAKLIWYKASVCPRLRPAARCCAPPMAMERRKSLGIVSCILHRAQITKLRGTMQFVNKG